MSLLDTTDLCFSYGDRPTLRGISLSLSAGETVALIGPNGSGKSTLIKSLLGHLHATGSVNWYDKPLVQWNRRELARRIAYLPQTPTYESGQTVADILRLGRAPYWTAFGLESASDAQVVTDIANRLALDDLLARPMDSLSGGQRQRVFVGRCLVQQPDALLLDEPDTYLDLGHQVELGRKLQSLARDSHLGILWASHDLNNAAAHADRLILLHDGAVLASGTAHEVLRPDLLSDVYGVPLERIDRPPRPPIVLPRI